MAEKAETNRMAARRDAINKAKEQLGPQLTKEETVTLLRFLTEPERLNLHGHEARDHVRCVDKLVEIAKHHGVPIMGEGA